MYLLRCEHCGKIYRVIDFVHHPHIEYGGYFITDFGGKIKSKICHMKCINCGRVCVYDIMECEDWVAHKVFTTKGS